MFIVLITSLVNASSHGKILSLRKKKSEIQAILINFHPNENSQELH